MAKTFYSEYVNHCLRFYARHPSPTFRNNSDLQNWNACEDALNTFPLDDRASLLFIYSQPGTSVVDNVHKLCARNDIKSDYVWKLVSDLERRVAINRGLI